MFDGHHDVHGYVENTVALLIKVALVGQEGVQGQDRRGRGQH